MLESADYALREYLRRGPHDHIQILPGRTLQGNPSGRMNKFFIILDQHPCIANSFNPIPEHFQKSIH